MIEIPSAGQQWRRIRDGAIVTVVKVSRDTVFWRRPEDPNARAAPALSFFLRKYEKVQS